MTLAMGILIGALVSSASNALFPDPPTRVPNRPASAPASNEFARWIALRATVIVMPVFILALTNPSFYVAAIMKTVALSQQAGDVDARSAGRELVGSTLMGALIAVIVWLGLSLHPSLWMLTLWMMGAALWAGSGIFGTRSTSFRPSFWSNALITMLILLARRSRIAQAARASSKRQQSAPGSSLPSRSMHGERSGYSTAGVT